MNQTALACGVESVKDDAYFKESVEKIIETREWAKKELKEMGFDFPDSRANFIFVTHPKKDAKQLFEELKQKQIYVRYWGSSRIEQYLRITIGTRQEMEILLAALRECLAAND